MTTIEYFKNNAKDKIEKKIFKLFAVGFYGKTLQNDADFKDSRVYKDITSAESIIQSPQFTDLLETRFGQVLASTKVKVVRHNKPIAWGTKILAISKEIMYHMIYEIIKPCGGELAYTDTDSVIAIGGADFIKNMGPFLQNHICVADCPIFHARASTSQIMGCYNVTGVWSSLNQFEPILSFTAVREKCYSITYLKKGKTVTDTKAKGVPRQEIDNLCSGDFTQAVLNDEKKYGTDVSIRSYGGQVFTQERKMLMINADSNKRVVCSDRIHTYAYGHKRIAHIDIEPSARKRRRIEPPQWYQKERK